MVTPDQEADETAYFLLRAQQEEAHAAAATNAEAPKAQRELAMRYAIRALLPPTDAEDDLGSFRGPPPV